MGHIDPLPVGFGWLFLGTRCVRTQLRARIKMPLLRMITNVERKDIPDNFLEEITDVLAQAIGKPREVGKQR